MGRVPHFDRPGLEGLLFLAFWRGDEDSNEVLDFVWK